MMEEMLKNLADVLLMGLKIWGKKFKVINTIEFNISLRKSLIRAWKIAGALVIPKDITRFL